MKKIVAFLLAAVMVISVFTGCTKKEDGSGSADGPVIISIYRPNFNLEGGSDPAQVQKVEDAVNAYLEEKKLGVQVKVTEIATGEYTEKANNALGNNEINLLWTASWEDRIGTNALVSRNAVYDITELVRGTLLYNSMDLAQWAASKYDGKIYFIPVYKDNVEGYDLMFRQELIDKHNWDISVIRKLADLEPFLADCRADGLQYPLLLQKSAMFYRFYIDKFDFFTANSISNFVSVDRATNQVINTVQTPEYREYCKLIAKWTDLGYISQNEVTDTVADTVTRSQEWGVSWWTDIPVNEEADSRYGQDVTMTPITQRWAHSTSALGSCYCVTANCNEAQAKACIDFMGLLYTDSKLADMWTFGIEGEDFEYTGDHRVTQKSSKYNHSMWESASATIVSPLDNEPSNKAELYKSFNIGANTSCAAGFRFDRSTVDSELTACELVFEQYGYELEVGGVAEADVDSALAVYQTALDEAGYQKVLAEFRSQYDAWKK